MGDLTEIQTAQVVQITDGSSQTAVLSDNPVGTEVGLVVRPVGTTNVAPIAPSSSDATNVSGGNSNVTLLNANTSRLGATIFNDSDVDLYIKLGTTASATSFTAKCPARSYYEVPYGYKGRIDGIWASAGSYVARITELT